MSKIFLIGAFVFGFANAMSQPTGYSLMKDKEQFQKKFVDAHNAIQSISCQFRQERSIAALKERIVSSGTLQFKKRNKVRIDYQPPLAHTIASDGERFLFREKNQTRESRGSFQKINNLMVTAADGSLLKRKDFQANFFESDSKFLVELIPTKSMKSFFKSIRLFVSPGNYLIESIVIEEADGDFTQFDVKDPKINIEIPDSVFTLN